MLSILILLNAFISCDSKEEVLNPKSSLQIQDLNFSELDRFFTRISHVKDDTLFFVDEAIQTLSKFSLLDQRFLQMALKLVGDFRSSKMQYISSDSILF